MPFILPVRELEALEHAFSSSVVWVVSGRGVEVDDRALGDVVFVSPFWEGDDDLAGAEHRFVVPFSLSPTSRVPSAQALSAFPVAARGPPGRFRRGRWIGAGGGGEAVLAPLRAVLAGAAPEAVLAAARVAGGRRPSRRRRPTRRRPPPRVAA